MDVKQKAEKDDESGESTLGRKINSSNFLGSKSLFSTLEDQENGLFDNMEDVKAGLFNGLDNKKDKSLPRFTKRNTEDEEDDDNSQDDEDDDDDDVTSSHEEGMYDPSEFEHLQVTDDEKSLFDHIISFIPQKVDLGYKLRPFIPDFIPAVGDIDAFVKVHRYSKLEEETLGLTVLDEPAAKPSDSNILELQLRSVSKQSSTKVTRIKKISNMDKESKSVDKWIKDIDELHRSKPPPTVQYTKSMPDIDSLLQEWPAELETMLKELNLPSADLDASLNTYVDIICSILDIPVYKSRIQALHILFTLYATFTNSDNFGQLTENNMADNNF